MGAGAQTAGVVVAELGVVDALAVPDVCIGLTDSQAVGLDGEAYGWTRLDVGEFRDGLLASIRQFEVDKEDAAFAYAATLLAPQPRRLAITNRASQISPAGVAALRARDVDGALRVFSNNFVYDDRRRMGGNPLGDLRTALERITQQYSVFEWRTLAVRGERLHLLSSRWSDESGNETVQLHVHELGDDGRIGYEGRFDEDDFEGAYRNSRTGITPARAPRSR